MTDLLDRIRERPEGYALAALALLVAGVVLAAHESAALLEEPVVQRDLRWSEAAAYTYSIPVTRNATLWPIGAELPMGEPAYFRTVADHVDVNFTWRASPGTSGLAHAQMVFRIRAQAPDGRSYWETHHELARASTSDPARGLALSGRLDMDALVLEAKQLGEQLPQPDGFVNWSVETTITYALQPGVRAEDGESTFLLPLDVSDPRFTLPAPDDVTWTRSHEDVQVSTVTRQAGLAGVLGSLSTLGLLAAGLAGLGLVAYGVRTDPGRGLADADAAFRRELERFKDWITESEGPLHARHLPPAMVDVATLEDLVRLAADARTRVVLDPAARVYYAILPTMAYRFAGHALVAPARHVPRVAPVRR